MDTRSRTSAQTRGRLLDATAQVVAEVGGAGLTMQAVAEKADVALRTVYNHFQTKEALVIEAYDRLAGATMDAIGALPTQGSARRRLARFVETFCDSYESQLAGRAVITGVPGIAGLDHRVAEVRRWRREELTKLVRDAASEEHVRLPVPQAVALAFLATAYASWEVLVFQGGMSAKAAKALLVTTVDSTLFG